MILLIDNFDSFTYNIYQMLRQLRYAVAVHRNQAITIAQIKAMNPQAIIISPGPGNPDSAGIAVDVVRHFAGTIPILGVCLGHQCIGRAFGANIVPAAEIYHGRACEITHDGKGMFKGLKNPLSVIRYHSLVIQKTSLSNEFDISALSEAGEIMAIRHKSMALEGVQFHPESIGTAQGMDLLKSFLDGEPEKMQIRPAIRKAFAGQDLTVEEAEAVMLEIASGEARPAQIAGLLTALSMKGEAVSELTGFARVMRRKVEPLPRPANRLIVDTCGTGGDRKGTFNISTAAAVVAAGAGITVAKHGNRSITSRCGSADVLEALGVNIMAPPEVMGRALVETGMAFLFAPKLHHSVKHAVPVRMDIGIPTAFNILGPLANPLAADCQVIGVFAEPLLEKLAGALIRLGCRRALVVHGSDGLDEITLTGLSHVCEIQNGWSKRWLFDPREFGFVYCQPKDLAGGDLNKNCEIILGILNGEAGPRRDIVLINAAAAILVGEGADDFSQALQRAKTAIDSGAAREKLQALIRITSC